jgi:hypothetical protein
MKEMRSLSYLLVISVLTAACDSSQSAGQSEKLASEKTNSKAGSQETKTTAPKTDTKDNETLNEEGPADSNSSVSRSENGTDTDAAVPTESRARPSSEETPAVNAEGDISPSAPATTEEAGQEDKADLADSLNIKGKYFVAIPSRYNRSEADLRDNRISNVTVSIENNSLIVRRKEASPECNGELVYKLSTISLTGKVSPITAIVLTFKDITFDAHKCALIYPFEVRNYVLTYKWSGNALWLQSLVGENNKVELGLVTVDPTPRNPLVAAAKGVKVKYADFKKIIEDNESAVPAIQLMLSTFVPVPSRFEGDELSILPSLNSFALLAALENDLEMKSNPKTALFYGGLTSQFVSDPALRPARGNKQTEKARDFFKTVSRAVFEGLNASSTPLTQSEILAVIKLQVERHYFDDPLFIDHLVEQYAAVEGVDTVAAMQSLVDELDSEFLSSELLKNRIAHLKSALQLEIRGQ